MRTLNREYRDVDSVTDVLSFSTEMDVAFLAEDAPLLLGDLVVCLPLAKQHAKRYRLSLKAELAALLAHGTLHLLGFEHKTNRGAQLMAEAEMGLLAAAGIQPEAALAGRFFDQTGDQTGDDR